MRWREATDEEYKEVADQTLTDAGLDVPDESQWDSSSHIYRTDDSSPASVEVRASTDRIWISGTPADSMDRSDRFSNADKIAAEQERIWRSVNLEIAAYHFRYWWYLPQTRCQTINGVVGRGAKKAHPQYHTILTVDSKEKYSDGSPKHTAVGVVPVEGPPYILDAWPGMYPEKHDWGPWKPGLFSTYTPEQDPEAYRPQRPE